MCVGATIMLVWNWVNPADCQLLSAAAASGAPRRLGAVAMWERRWLAVAVFAVGCSPLGNHCCLPAHWGGPAALPPSLRLRLPARAPPLPLLRPAGLIAGDGIWTIPAAILAIANVNPPICMGWAKAT